MGSEWVVGFVAYCLFAYTLGWRLFVWWEGLPRPDCEETRAMAGMLWLVSPMFMWCAPFLCVLWWVFRAASLVAVWVAFGGRR